MMAEARTALVLNERGHLLQGQANIHPTVIAKD
jgi:hypothetical protein